MLDQIKILIQFLLPKSLISKIVGIIAESNLGWFTQFIIMIFVKIYKVNMYEAKKSSISNYSNFNDFFVRSLREGIRPINSDPNILVFPADGIISQFGIIHGDQILQAKKYFYTLKDFLLNNHFLLNHFHNGSYITIYLSPRDYHRVHMPCNGVLREMFYVPGKLFSVNLFTTENIPNLFVKNERLICLFETDFGMVLQILVGAIIVGSIETVWSGTVTTRSNYSIKHWSYPNSNKKNSVVLLKGQEMGRFKLGSTVINIFSNKKVLLDYKLCTNYVTRIGKTMGYGIDL